VFKKVFAPILGLPSDTQTLDLAAEIGTYFHAHIDVGVHVRGHDRTRPQPISSDPSPDPARLAAVPDTPLGEEAPLDPAIVETLERWRQRYRLRSGPAGRHYGLPSTSWSSIDGGLERAIARRAIYADLTCLAVDRNRIAEMSAIVQPILFSSGRPLLLVPIAGADVPPVLGAPTVIGWNGTAEAVHATTSALPFLEISPHIDIISIGEEAVNAIEAYALARYLAHRRIRADASGIAKKDWTGGDVIDAAVARGARLLVMGAHVRPDERRFGNATRHMLEQIPIPVIMSS
jgi:nucleotide-binding universal stress UspA family protein